MSERIMRYAMLTDRELRLAIDGFHNDVTALRQGMNMLPDSTGQARFLFEATFLWETALEELHAREAEHAKQRKKKS